MTTGYLRHIHECTAHDASAFLPFLIEGQRLGTIKKDIADLLLAANDDFLQNEEGLSLHSRFRTYAERNEALDRATQLLCAHFDRAIRAERYPVIVQWGDAPMAELDRVAVPWFGTRGFGVHVNGYVEKQDGLYLWIAERSQDRPLDPGKLDHIVAGGSPIGLGIRENLAKESHEEACIPQQIVDTAKPVSALAYRVDRLGGVRYDTIFIFDMPLPENFVPHNTDGEVASFQLVPVAEVAQIVHDTDRFKFNCNLVIVDFLMRRGLIPTTHPEYQLIEEALASLREPFPT